MKIDLHSHSTVSDGTDSPATLVRKMAAAGLDAFALTDHDALMGLPEAREEARRVGIELISGAEISAEYGGQDDVHIVALFVDEKNASFNTALSVRQEARRSRGEQLAQKIVEAGYPLDLDAIRADVGSGVWGRPHIARALVRGGHAASMEKGAGGVTSIAHAVWYKEADDLIRALAAEGLDAIEVYHPDHGPADEARFARLADELGLLHTAGSDFHGTPEGRKVPGGVTGDRAMLDSLRARAKR